MNVREATTGDVPGIRRVAAAAYRAAYPAVLGADTVEDLLEDWYAPATVVGTLVNRNSRTFVAVEDGTVVGFASAGAEEDADAGTLGSLYVHPDRWGEGIGTRLLERAGAYLRERGFDRMRIHVFAENDVGVDFYAGRSRRVGRETHEIRGEPVPVAAFERTL